VGEWVVNDERQRAENNGVKNNGAKNDER